MRVLAVYNIKGGVGKTTTAVNMAHLSAAAGARTLLWDLDPQAAATFYFRVSPHVDGGPRKLVRGRRPLETLVRGTDYEGLDLLPADFAYRHMDLLLDTVNDSRGRLARLLRPLSASYDHIWLDCAPSISLVSEGIFEAADILLSPTIPTTLSLRTLEQLRRHLMGSRSTPEVLPFFCMVDRRKLLHKRTLESKGGLASSFLRTAIPHASIVERMGVERAPLTAFAPNSAPARAYAELWHEVMQRSRSWVGGMQSLGRRSGSAGSHST